MGRVVAIRTQETGHSSENFKQIRSKAIKVTIIGIILHYVISCLKRVKISGSHCSFKFGFISVSFYLIYPAGIYLLKVNNRNNRTRYEIWVNNKDTRTTPLAYFTPCSTVSFVNFEQVNAGWVNMGNIFILKLVLRWFAYSFSQKMNLSME